MNLLKKISTIPLLLLAALPLLYSIFFLLQQQYIRHSIMEKLEEGHLQVISLHKTDYTWVKKGKEIKVGRDLFDVKEWKEADGKVFFTGIYDKEEKQLCNELEKMMDDGRQNSSEQNSFVKAFTQLTAIGHEISWQLHPFVIIIGNHHIYYKEKIAEIFFPVFIPPPEI
jgi:hypothetical protein